MDKLKIRDSVEAGFVAVAVMSQPAAAFTEVPVRMSRVAKYLTDDQPSGSDSYMANLRIVSKPNPYIDKLNPFFDLSGSGSIGGADLIIQTQNMDPEEELAPLTNSKMISVIRSQLSLQVKEVAEVLHVQRPTVYSWIKDDAQPSAGNRERLQEICRIAESWKRLCHLPAEKLIRYTCIDGFSVLDLLKRDKIDEAAIMKCFNSLVPLRLKLKEDADKKRPIDETGTSQDGIIVSDQQYIIDAITGKRSTPS